MSLRVGTFNVQNLFAWRSVKGRRRRKKAPEIRAACARVIGDANVDVLALQEVSSTSDLADFNRYDLRGGYPFAQLFPGNSQRDMHLAVLSRHAIEPRPCVLDLPLTDPQGQPLVDEEGQQARFRRGFHSFEVQSAEGPIVFFLTHLKSQRPLGSAAGSTAKRPLPADAYRQAEARAGAALIKEVVDSGVSRVIVLGDFNDHDGQESSVAPLVHGLGLFDPLRRELPFTEDRWTARWKRYGQRRYDYVLLSPDLESHYISGSAGVHRQPPADQASDHRLVRVDLNLSL